MRLVLPEHIFAGQPVRAMAELENVKSDPALSFVCASRPPGQNRPPPAGHAREPRSMFPYLPKHDRDAANHSRDVSAGAVSIARKLSESSTRFPFGVPAGEKRAG